MNILDVFPRTTYPLTGGARVRAYNLLRRLSRNHEIRQFGQHRWRSGWYRHWVEEIRLGPTYRAYQYFHPVASGINEYCERIWVGAPVLSGAGLSLCRPRLLRRLLSWADIVLVEFPWQFQHCVRARPDGRFVLASHNVEALKFRSYAEAQDVPVENNPWLRRIERMERDAVERADLVLAVSPNDRRELIRRYEVAPSRVAEIPNGADTGLYCPVEEGTRRESKRRLGLPDRPTVIFTGTDLPPNRVGLRWVRRVVGMAPDLTFLVIGALFPGPRTEGNLIATGRIDDYSPYQKAADIAICPIQYGGGTKIKLMESLAAGLPVVAFVESIHGTSLRPGEHLLVAEPSEKALLEALRALAGDRSLAKRLGEAGRRHIVANHDWERIAVKLEAALVQLVESPSNSASSQKVKQARIR
jgi:glycosyltransferase involved in cell wall biosynthesis